MLLLYPLCFHPGQCNDPIYIPLCFYFIPHLEHTEMCRLNNLHSTMLLLYPWIRGWSWRGVTYLHSTMLLLYPGFQISHYPNSGTIYIPLCFYFIPSGTGWKSAMVRFTFHYASTLSPAGGNARAGGFSIYIPLCFYFILSNIKRETRLYSFTFHYASTLSRNLPLRTCSLLPTFTFHYASTLSPGAPEYNLYHL